MRTLSQSKPKTERGVTSHCLICGRDYFDVILDKCKRCGGKCNVFTDEDMALMERRQTRGEIHLGHEFDS
jgi:hypothetical protein